MKKGKMKRNYLGQRVPTRFEPETRFEVNPVPAAPMRGAPEAELEAFKERLSQPLLQRAEDAELLAMLRAAIQEAAALAWTTPFPLLFLPALVEEKATAAQHRLTRQRQIRRRSQALPGPAK
jgi:hypothetical protein